MLPAEAEIEDPDRRADELARRRAAARPGARARHLHAAPARGVGRPGHRHARHGADLAGVRRRRAWRRSASTRWRPTRATCTRCCIAGNDEQLETFLRPLAEGRMRSCFAMTEPDVASSRPDEPRDDRGPRRRRVGPQRPQVVHHRRRRRRVRDRRRQDRRRRGGRPPQLLADPRPDRHAGLADRPPSGVDGLALARRASRDRARATCASRSATCSASEGEGFVIAQKRLAGGRLAHAMRWIGVAQRALDLTAQRLL